MSDDDPTESSRYGRRPPQAVLDRIDGCVADRIAEAGLAGSVHSLVRYGSSERGDFVPGLSDLDYFLVIDDGPDGGNGEGGSDDRPDAADGESGSDDPVRADEVVDGVEAILRACADPLDHRGIDLAWEYRSNLGDREAGVPFKFLTVYQFDFREHRAVVFGTDPLADVPERTFESELPARLDRIERLAAEHADDDRMVRIGAGEVARLRALLDGADSLRKGEVAATLEAHGRSDAVRVYRAYLDGADLPPGVLRSFVDRSVAAMREEVGGGPDDRGGSDPYERKRSDPDRRDSRGSTDAG